MSRMKADSGDHQSKLLEVILNRILKKDSAKTPKTFEEGDDAVQFLKCMDVFMRQLEISEETQADFFIEYLEEDVQCFLKSQWGYTQNQKSFEWLKETFLKLYGRKKSDISSWMKLFGIRQKDGQSTKEFMKEVRIRCFKELPELTSEEREPKTLQVFINGLMNDRAQKALKVLQPKTLDEAFEMIKKECVTQEMSATVNVLAENDEIRMLRDEVSELNKRITSLQETVKMLQQERQSSQWKGDNRTRNPVKETSGCWNCGSSSHILRDCKKSRSCKKCNKKGHIDKFCLNGKRKSVHVVESASISSNESETDTGTGTEEPSICHISNAKKSYARAVKETVPKQKEQNNLRVKKSSYKVKDQNKPMCYGRINGNSKKILLDTGAEVNAISKDMLMELQDSDKTLKTRRSSRKIKCADGFTVPVRAEVSLIVELGAKGKSCNFFVVDGLSPDIILGIRSMKSLGIKIDLDNNGVNSGTIFVPFVSKVNADTTVPTNQLN